MAGRISVGSVSVSIVPSAEGFSEKVKAIVEDASKDDVRIKVDADTTEADAKIDETRARADSLNKSAGGAGGGISLMAAGIALALPLLPELAAGLVAVSGAVAVAGAGLAGFGAVALTDITNATDATTKLQAAQLAVQNATSPQARADALTKEQALITSLGPSTIALGTAITSLGNAWKSFAAGFTPEITRDVTQFANILTTSLPLVQPLIAAGAGAVSTILSNLNVALQSPAAKDFFAWIAGTAEQDILGLTRAFGGFGAGVLKLFQDFAPLEALVTNGLAAMGNSFESWASHLTATQGFQQFLAYATANGPLLVKTLGDIGTAFAHILAALTPLLPPLLQIIDFAAKLITSLPPLDFIIGVSLVLAFKTLGAAIDFLTNSSLATFVEKMLVSTGVISGVGDAAAGATPEVRGLGLALDTAGLSAAGFIAAAAGIAVVAATIVGAVGGVAYAISQGPPAGQQKAYLDYVHGKITRAQYDAAVAAANPGLQAGEIGQYQGNQGSIIGYNDDGSPIYGNGFGTNVLTSVAEQMAAKARASTTVNDQTAANLQGTFNSQVPGLPGSNVQPDPSLGKGTGAPPAYSLPNSATGGGSAAVNAALNNAQGIAALLGLNLVGALASGIQTGTNGLAQAFQNINLKLTGPAQTLGTALQNIFSSALSYGQAAANSLKFSVTAAPTVGTSTLISPGANGLPQTTVQSQLVGSSFNALVTDQKFVADITKAKQLGLSAALLGQFVTAGPSSLATLDALVNSGSGAIAQLNQNNAAIDALGNTYGVQTASDKYLPSIDATLKQIAADAPAKTGAHVAAAISKPAASGARTARLTPGRGVATAGTSGRRAF